MFIIPLKNKLKKKEKNLLEIKEIIKWIEEINKIHGINIASLKVDSIGEYSINVYFLNIVESIFFGFFLLLI